MKRKLLLVFWAAVLGSPWARAATVFNVTGVFPSDTVMSGTITIDTTTGLGVSSDVFLSAPHAGEYQFIQTQFNPSPGVTILQLGTMAMGVPQLILAFPVQDFTGYTGGVICAPFPCGGGSNWFDGRNVDVLTSGSLTPASSSSPAPEAASGWLLGLGLALIAIGRRTFAISNTNLTAEDLSPMWNNDRGRDSGTISTNQRAG